MDPAIVVSIITGIFTLAGTIITVVATGKKRDAEQAERDHARELEQAKRDQKLDDRLANVEAKLDEHNGYAQKFGEVAVSIAELRKDVQYIKENKD